MKGLLLAFFCMCCGVLKAACLDGNEVTINVFDVQANATIVDKVAGLQWMRCSQGQNWNGSTCSGSIESHSWKQAMLQAKSHRFAGFTDWRLPTYKELVTILETVCFNPAIKKKVFPGTPSVSYWTSSRYASNRHSAWAVNFQYGDANANYIGNSLAVRLVRTLESGKQYQ